MGAAVAIDLASRHRRREVQTFSAFPTLSAAAQAPWLPVSRLLKSRFDNLSKFTATTCPVLIVHGTTDPAVPAFIASRLAQAAGGNGDRLLRRERRP